VLVVNAGSSSLKLRLLGEDNDVLASADLATLSDETSARALAEWVHDHGPVDAVGHRVVHGGFHFTGPTLIDRRVVEQLHALVDLAPLHQPMSLTGIDAVTAALPTTPAVACFDTAFHAHLPPAAATYAIPGEWRRRWGLRRFGFHGLSHAYASRRAADIADRDPATLRVVTCHLGSGASLAAVVGGRSVDTTMGFTPLEGLVMGTRSGSVDPGLLLWLEDRAGMARGELASALEHESGLLALAGTADMREVVARTPSDDAARLALDVYLHRLCAGIAAMAAAATGLDVLVFTGGVGENAPQVRKRAADGLAFLGVAVDPSRNHAGDPDRDITAADASIQTLVIAAREDIEIATQVRAVLA
jgi:acetate kinase